MKKIEDLFKNKLSTHQSLDGVDADALWGAIDNTLGTVDGPKGSSKLKWTLILLLLFVTIGTGVFVLNMEGENENLIVENVKVIKKEKLEDTKSKVVLKNNETTVIKEHIESNLVNSNVKAVLKHKAVKTANNRVKKSLVKSTNFNKNNIAQISSSVELIERYVALEKIEKKHSTNMFMGGNVDGVNIKDVTVYSIANTKGIVKIQKITNKLQYKDNVLPPFLELDAWQSIEIEPRMKKWTVGVESGFNIMHTQYVNNSDGDLHKVLQDANNARVGASTSLKVSYALRNNLFISTGLAYNRIINMFAHTEVTQVILHRNRVVSYDLDINTGERVNEEREWQDVNGERTHKVVHHNTFDLISVPVSLGIKTNIQRVTVGMELGLTLNYFLTQNGRFLDNERTFVLFNSNNETLPYRKAFLGVHLDPFMEINIKKNLNFRLTSTLKYLNNGSSELYKRKQSSFILGAGAGFGYKF